MQASEWPYFSSNFSPPILSCSRYGYIAAAYSNILTIYKNTPKGLTPISSSTSFEWNIRCLSWCTTSNSESSLPLTLFIGFDQGNGSIFDIPSFSIISTINVSKSAILSAVWSNISSNHLFLGCEDGDLISLTLVKSADNKNELAVIISWIVQTGFAINQLSINYSDCNTLISASLSGKFVLYDEIYEKTPNKLFSGIFEGEDNTKDNTILSTTDYNLVQCGFHPYANDIFYIVTERHVYFGFIKEKTTITLFPSSTFSQIIGIFFPISDSNSLVIIQKSSSFLLHYTDGQRWKRIQEIPHFTSTALAMANTEFDRDSYLIATKGSNLSIIKYYRKKLFVVSLMRNLIRKPKKIAVGKSYFAFIVQVKTKTKIPSTFIYLYLAPQSAAFTNYCLYYNLNLINNYSNNFCNSSNINSNATSFSKSHKIQNVTQVEWISDTDLVFSANCDDNKHKLFYFNYKKRELISILKPQLEYLFTVGNNLNLFSQSSSNKLDLDESTSSEISLKSEDDKPFKLTQSSSSLFSSQTSYYNSLVANDLSIRLNVHSNYLAITIGHSVVEFYSISESQQPKPIEFDNKTIIILSEPSAISFINGTNKVSIFYKSRYEIYELSKSFELIETNQYLSDLKSTPILAYSFSLHFHLIVLDNGDVIKFDSSFSPICKIIHANNLKVSNDFTHCLISDMNKYVYVLNLTKKSIKHKTKLKRCDFISNSIVFSNVYQSHCFSFRSICDLNRIDMPRTEQRLHVRSFAEFKHHLNRLCNFKVDLNHYESFSKKAIHFPKRKSKPEFVKRLISSNQMNTSQSSQFNQLNLNDLNNSSNSNSNQVDLDEQMNSNNLNANNHSTLNEFDLNEQINSDQLNNISKSNQMSLDKQSNSNQNDLSASNGISDQTQLNHETIQHLPNKQLMSTLSTKTDAKINHNTPVIHHLTTNRIHPTKITIKPTKSTEFIPELIQTPNKNLIDVSIALKVAESMHLFYLSDLLLSATQFYDPRCYGINLNKNNLIYYLLSFANMLGDMQKQQINRRQAIYHKLANDKYGTLSCLLTVDRSDDDSFIKTIMKAALMSVKVDPENFQMMLEVLLENGFDEDVTDLMLYSDMNSFHTVERFIRKGEIEFAVLTIKMMLDNKINQNQSNEGLNANQNKSNDTQNRNQLDETINTNELNINQNQLDETSNKNNSNELKENQDEPNIDLNCMQGDEHISSNQISNKSQTLINQPNQVNDMLSKKSEEKRTSSSRILNENEDYYSLYDDEEYDEPNEEMDIDTDSEETDVTESSQQLDQSSSNADDDTENNNTSELELKKTIENVDKKQFDNNEKTIKKLEIQQNKNDTISLILRFFGSNKRRHQIVPFLIGMKMFKEAAGYLDDFREHQCASIVRALVVSRDENNEEHVYIDCSLLTK